MSNPSLMLTEEEQALLRKGVHQIPKVMLSLRKRLGLSVKSGRVVIQQFLEEEQAKPKEEDGDSTPSPS